MIESLSGEFDPGQFKSVLEILQVAAQKHGDRPGFTCFKQTLTYADLDRLSDQFANYLLSETDLVCGDRIAIQLPNLLQFPIALIGAMKANLVVVNTNPLYTSREMLHQFEDSGVKAIVILENFCDKLEEIIGDTDIKHVMVTRIGDFQSPLQRLIMNAGIRYIKKLVPVYELPGAVDFFKAVNSASSSFAKPTDYATGDDVALILYTGGTTGYAKGVKLSHNNLIVNMMQMRIRCLEVISDRVETIIGPLPLYHTYAFLFHCVLLPYAGNHTILVPNPRDLDSLVDVLKNNEVSGLVGINTLYLALLQRSDLSLSDFDTLRFCGAGGMPLTQSVADDWEALTKVPIYEGYGLTECSPVVSVNSPSHFKAGTVGIPMAETEVKVVDDEDNEVATGEKGELLIRGPQVMSGYWNREEDTREVLSEDGWFRSGDYAQVDDEGYIKIVDRKKDMILVSGFNVIPGEIEEFVNTHPAILESAAIGVPSAQTGESVVLYLVCKDKELTKDDVLKYCKTGLTAYKLPREILFVDDLPKSIIGKVLRRELRETHLASNQVQ